MPITWLSEKNLAFPPHTTATDDGMLAIGGDLSPQRILTAYRQGIFPWFNEGDPILWWSPDPRFVLFPNELKISRSMRPYFNQQKFTVSFDQDFWAVILNCQNRRIGRQDSTWITDDIAAAYHQLHHFGYTHSVEVWQDGELVGGLYGLCLGKCFFGESMFTHVSNASKFGFIALVQKLHSLGFWLIDCQQQTRHLGSLGARAIPRENFLEILRKNEGEQTLVGNWGKMLP